MNKISLALLVLLIACFFSYPVIAADSEVVSLNNQGVKALTVYDFDLAIEKFRHALKLDPNYKLGKQNLAIVYNNAGLKYRLYNFDRALSYFHEALFLDPLNLTTQQNLAGMQTLIGLDPNSFYDRVILGLEYELVGDSRAAIVEFWTALKLRPDKDISQVLEKLIDSLQADDVTFGDEFRSKPLAGKMKDIPPPVIESDDEADAFILYIRDLNRAIKNTWKPPSAKASYKTIVLFKIYRGGTISDEKILISSGSEKYDEVALEAIKNAAPFHPPPMEKLFVEIRFSFDYNLFSDGAESARQVRAAETTRSWQSVFPALMIRP